MGEQEPLEAELRRSERQRAFLQRSQAREALTGRTGPDTLDARDRQLRVEQGLEGGRLTLPQADRGAAKRLQDALGRLAESRAKAVLDEEKDLATQRLQVLERFHGEGLIAEREFWATRLEIQREATGREVAAIDAEVQARRAALARSERGTDEQVNAQRELEEAIARRNRVEREFGAFAVTNSLNAAAAARTHADALSEVEARVLSIQGQEERALAIRQAISNRSLRARATTDQDEGALRNLAELERQEQIQARINRLRDEGGALSARLALEEERIQNSRRVGAISEFEALGRTGEARQAAVVELRGLATALDEAAQSSGLKTLLLEAEQFRVAMESLASQTDLLAAKFQTIGESAGAEFLTDAIFQTKSLKDAFKDMVDSIARDITRIASENISKAIFGGESGQGFGNFVANLFRGFSGSGGGVGGGGIEITDALAAMGAFQHGGSFMVGGAGGPDSQLVAFKGSPGEKVTVTPAGQSSGGVTVINHFNGQTPTDRRSQQQIAAEVSLAVNRATARNR